MSNEIKQVTWLASLINYKWSLGFQNWRKIEFSDLYLLTDLIANAAWTIRIRCNSWRKTLQSNMFDICTAGLQKSLADFIKNIFINKVEQKRNKSSLGSFLACRLSILDNEIWSKPIKVGEMSRKTARKVVIAVVKDKKNYNKGKYDLLMRC